MTWPFVVDNWVVREVVCAADRSEFERVARAGWMVTLRYRLLLATQPPYRPAKWRWAAGGASAAMAAAGVITKLGWF